LQGIRQVEALAAEGLVHVLAEGGTVLEAFVVDHSVDVLGEIGHDIVLELSHSRIDRRVQARHVDYELSVGDVRVGAVGGDVVLGGPNQADPLAGAVGGHRVFCGVGGADGIGSGITASHVVCDLVVESCVHSES
jgi:hypothetical protein